VLPLGIWQKQSSAEAPGSTFSVKVLTPVSVDNV
jgi:hypothetical protein